MTAKAKPKPITFQWDGDTFEAYFDSDKWSIGEMRAVERAFGAKVEDFGMLDQTSAVLAVSIKRHRPDFKIADVDTLPMELVGDLLEKQRSARADEREDPTPPADDASTAGDETTEGN